MVEPNADHILFDNERRLHRQTSLAIIAHGEGLAEQAQTPLLVKSKAKCDPGTYKGHCKMGLSKVYLFYIRWPFPPVWGVADNTKETDKNNGGFTPFFQQ